jgi:hypothetical protein
MSGSFELVNELLGHVRRGMDWTQLAYFRI